MVQNRNTRKKKLVTRSNIIVTAVYFDKSKVPTTLEILEDMDLGIYFREVLI